MTVAVILLIFSTAVSNVMRRSISPLVHPCVWTNMDKYPECAIVKEVQTQTTPLTLDQVKIMCGECFTTVNHYLSIDDLGVCQEFLVWASALREDCASIELNATPCPDVAAGQCGELGVLGIENWAGGKPSNPILLQTLNPLCSECLKIMDVDLSHCPSERSFNRAMRAACIRVTQSACVVPAFEKQFPGNRECAEAMGILQQYGLQPTQSQVSNICGICLPFLQDIGNSWESPSCPGSVSLVVNDYRVICTGSSGDPCVMELLSLVSDCGGVISSLLGESVQVSISECTICLNNAVYALRMQPSQGQGTCSHLNNTLTSLVDRCNANAFSSIKCSSLMRWLDSNHTSAEFPPIPPPPPPTSPPTPTPSGNASSRSFQTQNGNQITATQSLSISISQSNEITESFTVTDTIIPGPCNEPHTCLCVQLMKPSFSFTWRYQLPICGLDVTQKRKQCACQVIKDEFYESIPGCNGLLDSPDIISVCRLCLPHINEFMHYVEAYDECFGSTDGISRVHGLQVVCEPEGIGTGVCPAALKFGASLQNCEGTFTTVIDLSLRGNRVTSDDFRDLLCTNGTLCSGLMMEYAQRRIDLATCGIHIADHHHVCQCWQLRTKFFDAAKHCSVLVNEGWKKDAMEFDRLCLKCYPDLLVNERLLKDYGDCTGRGEYFTTDLRGNVAAVCSQPYQGPQGYGSAAHETTACVTSGISLTSLQPESDCRISLCKVEQHVKGCSLVTAIPNYASNESAVKLVCSDCMGPIVAAIESSTTSEGFQKDVSELMNCNPRIWSLDSMATQCDQFINICDFNSEFCDHQIDFNQSCSDADQQKLQHLGLDWSRCLSRNEGERQCDCAIQIFKQIPKSCFSHPVVSMWLCRVRNQACHGVQYPLISQSECQQQLPFISWDATLLETKYATCSKAEISSLFQKVADECLPITVNSCNCTAVILNSVSVQCTWDSLKEELTRIKCLIKPTCMNPEMLPTSETECDSLLKKESETTNNVVDGIRISMLECTSGMRKLTTEFVKFWEECFDNLILSECDCLKTVHSSLHLLSPCTRYSPEWETIKCIAAWRCPRQSYFVIPNNKATCQESLYNPNVDYEGRFDLPAIVTQDIERIPVCDLSQMAEQFVILQNCFQLILESDVTKGHVVQIERCKCLSQFGWSIPITCRNQPTAVWTHIRCVASDMKCTSIPTLHANTCDYFYAFQSKSEVHTIESSITTRLIDTIESVPPHCVSSHHAIDFLRSCLAEATSQYDLSHHGSCRCLELTYKRYKSCDLHQPLVLEIISCKAVTWECPAVGNLIDTPRTLCNEIAASESIESPYHRECVSRNSLFSPQLNGFNNTCDNLARYQLLLPSVCKTISPTRIDYQISLCESIQKKCSPPPPEYPNINCRAVLSENRIHTLMERNCRQVAMQLGKVCHMLLKPISETTRQDYEEGCEGECFLFWTNSRSVLTGTCSETDSWFSKWIQSRCIRDTTVSSSIGKYAGEYLREFTEATLIYDHQRTYKDGGQYWAGVQSRETTLGLWPIGGNIENLINIFRRKPNSWDMNRLCTQPVLQLLEILKGHYSIRGLQKVCTGQINPKPGFQTQVWCNEYTPDWDWTSTGVENVCATRCYRKMAMKELQSTVTPVEGMRRLIGLNSICNEPPQEKLLNSQKGKTCMSIIQDVAVTGVPFNDASYPVRSCSDGISQFTDCRRSGLRNNCECLSLLLKSAPSRVCLQNSEVAPITLCLLNPDYDRCINSDYFVEYSTYCTPPVLEDSSCRQMLWNKNIPCSVKCHSLFQTHIERWGCCAGTYNQYLESISRNRISLKNVEAACNLRFETKCAHSESDLAFAARVVFVLDANLFLDHPTVFENAIKKDVIETLGIWEHNIVAIELSAVNISVSLERQFSPLSAVQQQLQAELIIRGDYNSEVITLMRDFQGYLLAGFPFHHFRTLFARYAPQQIFVNNHLSVVLQEFSLSGANYTDSPLPTEALSHSAANYVKWCFNLMLWMFLIILFGI